MEPKGDKKPTLNPYRFCVTPLFTFGIILAPKVVLFEPYFGSKTDLFPKVVILSKYCTGHTDSRFRPLKKEPNLMQKLTKIDAKTRHTKKSPKRACWAPFWEPFWLIFRYFFDVAFLFVFDSFLDRFGSILAPFWEHLGALERPR